MVRPEPGPVGTGQGAASDGAAERRAEKRSRRRVARLTRRGWLLAVVGAVSLVTAYASGHGELLALGILGLALPALAYAWVRFRRLGFRADRSFTPPVVQVGASSVVELQLTNLAPNSSPAAWWRDTWPWRPFVTQPRELPPLTAAAGYRRAGTTATLRYEVRPNRRGVFEVGPLIVDFTDPFRLADSAVTAEGMQRLIVTPAVSELPEGALALAVDEGPTTMPTRRTFGGDDDTMTREYRRGDAMRRVHWRATAHKGELMVRQEEQQNNAEARIAFDTTRRSYRDSRGAGTVDEPESDQFEWAVSFVASLAGYLVVRGFAVHVVETGSPQLATLDDPAGFLESLAAVHLTDLPAEHFTLSSVDARPDRPLGSVFAVLADTGDDAVARLLSERRSFDLAIAFLLGQFTSRHLTALREAGWICVPVHPEDTIEDAWLLAGAAQEEARG